jgi:hypothetical protein
MFRQPVRFLGPRRSQEFTPAPEVIIDQLCIFGNQASQEIRETLSNDYSLKDCWLLPIYISAILVDGYSGVIYY